MTEKLRTKTTFRYGFAPNNIQKFRRFLAAFFIMVFRLNANSNWATEVCQMLRPVSKVKFADRELIFKSGHGRLK
jgi:hypothetical protein